MARVFGIWMSLFILLTSWIPISLQSPIQEKVDVSGPITSLARHQPRAPILDGSHRTASSISRRKAPSLRRDWIIDYRNEGWELWFDVYHQFMGVSDAASVLGAFFTRVKDHCLELWLTEDPLKAVSIEIGQLVLQLRCETEAIPWRFIALFAERMAISTGHGFAGFFDAILGHVVSGGVVYVKLWKRPDIAPAA